MRRSVLVTGGAGFVGSHLVDALVADGHRVVVVDDLSSGVAARLAPEAELEAVSIADGPAFDAIADRAAPEAIFHLAAQASVTVSVQDPGHDCEVNVRGTLNVLEAAGRHGASVVFTSTGGALYGDEAPIPTSEERMPAPLSPYGASKWAAESYVSTWSRASGLPHAICRLGNVYGPRQSPHGEAGVVSIFSHRLWRGEAPPVLYGAGEPTRDYVHVEDVVRALRAASGTAGVFNVGTGRETSTHELLGVLQAVAGTSVEPEHAPLREGELARSCLDASRARDVLGWSPGLELREGLAGTYRALVREFETGDRRG